MFHRRWVPVDAVCAKHSGQRGQLSALLPMCLQCRMLWRQVNRLVPEIEGFLNIKTPQRKFQERTLWNRSIYPFFYVYAFERTKTLKLSKFLCQNLGKILPIYFVILFESFETFWLDFKLRVLGTNIWNSQTFGSKKVFKVSSKLWFVAHPRWKINPQSTKTKHH